MRLIKNFLHNINDIVLAIIIVALAAGIIYWRMQIILDYPEQLAEEQAVYNEDNAETVSGTEESMMSEEASAPEAQDGEDAGTATEEQTGEQSEGTESPETEQDTGEESAEQTDTGEQPEG